MGIRVKVTQEHIDRAIDESGAEVWSACVCPVAQAFIERFGEKEVYAMADGIDIHHETGKHTYFAPRHESVLSVFMTDFDNDPYSVKPTSFIFDKEN